MLATLVPEWRTPAPGASDADVVTETIAPGPWTVLAGSRRGRLHAHRGDHREDAVALRVTNTGWCGAVADGAGSAPWSRIGAAVATHTFCAAFAAATGPSGARAAIAADAVFDRLRAIADAFEVPARALRTTLLVAAVTDHDVVTMQVGDGGIVLVDVNGTVSSPQAGDSGEFSGEVTHFLPDDGSRERLQASLHVTPRTHVHALLLASDGIEDPWYPLARHAPLLITSLTDGVSDTRAADIQAASGVAFTWRGPVCAADDASTALGEWLSFEKRGENDDRSLLFARLRHGT
jgi:Protein phosphatase 2C